MPHTVLRPVLEQPAVEPIQTETSTHPDVSMTGSDSGDGYEWLTYNGMNYYRLSNSGAEWTLWQG